ncbi:MAG: hypothetical protein LBC60_05930 [Spirochaetaceae bacterium]|jgi:hypothetical protein|nr:hypothetical protein [Spirochaetaceae bacterium]
MGIALEFNEAAFRHGISREDIVSAIKTKIYDAPLAEFPDKYVVIGFDTNGNPLEIMYNPIDDDTISVFHAMKARRTFLAQIGV